MKIILITLGILLFNAVDVKSQQYIDIVKVSGKTTSNNVFDSSSTTTKVSQLEIDLTLPFKLNDHTAIFSGLTHKNTNTKIFAGDNNITLGSTMLKIGLDKQLGKRWSGTIVVLPKLTADYSKIANGDIQIGAVVLIKFKKHNRLSYKFGTYYNSEIFGPFIVLMAGLYYLSSNENFEVNLMLPRFFDINYKVLPRVKVGFNFLGQNTSYRLSNISSSYKNAYIVRSTNEFYGYLKFNATKSISVQTSFGHSVARSFRVYETNDKVVPIKMFFEK